MIINLHMLEINQAIGTFYVGKIDSASLVKITRTARRTSSGGIQRDLAMKRVKEIAKYCEDPDAAFPTPIIININEVDIDKIEILDEAIGLYKLEIDDSREIAEILDGQHRIEGIKQAEDFNCELMVVVMFDLTEEEKAYIFSTINSNQTKVDKSLIFDLFELSSNRSPQKTCHEIARIMNSVDESPFYGRLKMLGKKGEKNATLSQGTFVNYLCKLISLKPQQDMIDIKNGRSISPNNRLVLRQFFIDDRDDIILKILINYFSAVADIFPEEWNNSEQFILAKTTGYGALIKAFPVLFNKGVDCRKLSKDFFANEFMKVKAYFDANGINFTSQDFQSGEQGQRALANLITSVW